MDMIERVAQAIAESSDDGAYNVMSMWDARRLARVAIEAMRLPTGSMIHAGVSQPAGKNAAGVWFAMIDTALGKVDA